ncbi:MAG: hypothetical protein CM15mP3_09490 [Candidatus Poseidoniales archaeon]|nr:MAG: hypothetical protein CM15mP3_09490 [Candidatus Poseidoniales archaeon]
MKTGDSHSETLNISFLKYRSSSIDSNMSSRAKCADFCGSDQLLGATVVLIL